MTSRLTQLGSAKCLVLKRGFCLSLLMTVSVTAYGLTLDQAQDFAIEFDQGIGQVLSDAEAIRSDAVAKSQLPDPVILIGAQNLPVDTFKFDQEPMTQMRVGIRQMFPKGDSLDLLENKMQTKANMVQENARLRYLEIRRQVRNLWLEVQYWQHAKSIFRQDERLFQQLLEVTRSLYSVGKVQQQDVLRAELELSRLKENLIKAELMEQSQRSMLSRWAGRRAETSQWPVPLPILTIPQPALALTDRPLQHSESSLLNNMMSAELVQEFAKHPQLEGLQKGIDEADVEIRLAEQQYKPGWGVELSYAYRDGENNDGSSRADFLSAVVTVSVPLFSSLSQDKSVESSRHRKTAQTFAMDDKLQQMAGEVKTVSSRLQQTDIQLALFDDEILDKARQQAEASLSAYQADAADFTEVMRAYLGEQKDRLNYHRLLVTRLQLISELQYYFPTNQPDIRQLQGDRAL